MRRTVARLVNFVSLRDLVWAEKYRPRTLDEMMDREEIVAKLKTFVSTKNMPHLLFVGPPGTSKTTASLALVNDMYDGNTTGNYLELNASVTPETPIMVREKGQIRRTNFAKLAKERFPEDGPDHAKIDGLEILSLDEGLEVKFLPVSLISQHRVGKVLRIRHEGGEIRTSSDHSVMVVGEFGLLEPKRASELKKGDLLVTFQQELSGRNEPLDFEEFAPRQYVTLGHRLIRNPKVKTTISNQEVDEDLGWLLGLYLAEGCAVLERKGTSGQVIFTLSYPEELDVLERLEGVLERKFGLEGKARLAPSGFKPGSMSAVQHRVMSTQLAKFLRSDFYDGSELKDATTKRVPNFVYSSSPEVRNMFLKGYMGDGCGNWGEYVRYSSNSRENLIDIAWLGRITGLNTSTFRQETRIAWKMPSYSYIKSDLVPAELLRNLAVKLQVQYTYDLRHSLYSGKKRISKSIAKELLQKWSRSRDRAPIVYDNVRKLVESNLSVVIIREMVAEDYDGYVYDVTVPGSEMFFGGTTPILLHNSDDRGIEAVRGRIKEFSKSIPIAEIPFKIAILDECDAMTNDAFQALRRTLERYSDTTRFILVANELYKIIEPIQSRCSVFRFGPLGDDIILKRLKQIADSEGVRYDDEALKMIVERAGGDMRMAINLIQGISASQKKVDAKTTKEFVGLYGVDKVDELIDISISGNTQAALELLRAIIYESGVQPKEIVRKFHRRISNMEVPPEVKLSLLSLLADIEYRLMVGADPEIQLTLMLAKLSQIKGNR